MARSVTARLEQLEAESQQRRGVMEAAKDEQAGRAFYSLSSADADAIKEIYAAEEEAPAWWEEVRQAGELLSGLPLPSGDAARAWTDQVKADSLGLPFACPPKGAAVYLEAEAARCDVAPAIWEAEGLPEGVGLSAALACARWSAAQWRFYAALARVLLEE